jgi:flagellar hook-associated protein 2
MTTISNLGIGAGIDTAGLLDQITQAEQAPITNLKNREAAYNTQLSAYGTLQGLLANLQTAAKQLSDPTFMGAYTASSSASGVLGVAATSNAVAGTYSVNVGQLAQSQSLVSAGVASTTASLSANAANITIDFGSISGGTLNSTTGTYTGAAFTPDSSQKSITVSLAAGTATLTAVRDAINNAAGGAVTASIVNDGTSNHLALTSTATGQKSSMRVGVDNTDLAAILGEDPAGTQNMRQTIAAQDAALTVNGLAVTSASNTVSDAVQGVTMTLAGTGASSLSVQRDTASMTSGINGFVSAYNRLNTMVKSLTAYDPSNQSGGVLLGDSSVRIIQSRLRETLTAAHLGQSGDPTMLSNIGVGFQKDGSLAVDSAKLSAAVSSNAAGVGRLFIGSTAAPGLMAALSSSIDDFNSDQGTLHLAQSGATDAITQLQKNETSMQDRVDAEIAIYRQQFQSLDVVMSNLKATSNYLTQQFASTTTSSK